MSYTPTTEEIRDAYLLDSLNPSRDRKDFNRWLAEHDWQVKDETVNKIVAFLESQTGQPEIVGYAHLAASTIRWWYDGTQLKEEA